MNVGAATNAIGDPFLQAFWTDPNFDPHHRSFYFVRVFEIPTPRWTTHDANFFGADRDDVAESIQERADTGPIWYTVKGEANKSAQAASLRSMPYL